MNQNPLHTHLFCRITKEDSDGVLLIKSRPLWPGECFFGQITRSVFDKIFFCASAFITISLFCQFPVKSGHVETYFM